MSCNGNIRSCSIDGVVSIGVDSIVGTLEQVLGRHVGFESGLQFERC